MLYLKEDNGEASFTLLGTELHTFGSMYLNECFPKETVKSWYSEVNCAIAGCSNEVLMYLRHTLFLTYVAFNFIHENSYVL